MSIVFIHNGHISIQMIALILAKKIASLYLMMAIGFILVRLGIIKASDSKILSLLLLYATSPCIIFATFQIDYSEDARNGLVLAFAASIVMMFYLIFSSRIAADVCHLNDVEKASLGYSNSNNFTIPIVMAVLGSQWAIFANAYLCVQLVFIWSHCKAVLSGDSKIEIMKVLGNINIIAMVLGLVCFLTGYRPPDIIMSAVEPVGNMNGPIAMLIIGTTLGGADLKKLFLNKRTWFTCLIRNFVISLPPVFIIKYFPFRDLVEDSSTVLLVTLLGTIAPIGATVTMLSQLYDNDVEEASALNILSTLLSIASMPLLVLLYQM